jgi:hypothetical protein
MKPTTAMQSYILWNPSDPGASKLLRDDQDFLEAKEIEMEASLWSARVVLCCRLNEALYSPY